MNNQRRMFRIIMRASEMDRTYITSAKKEFLEYSKRNIIYDSLFYQDIWHLNDEYSHTSVSFMINQITYQKWYKPIFNMSIDEFIEYFKTYIIWIMGEYGVTSIQTIARNIRKLIESDPNDLEHSALNMASLSSSIIHFIDILPNRKLNEGINDLINNIEDLIEYNVATFSDNKRNLAAFESYFIFNDIIEEYWKMELSYKDRIYYYPLYLWWKITCVIPLRPREFILTPRDCLELKSDGFYITLRRNKIKGSKRSVNYKIDEDYDTSTYKIPKELAEVILMYQNYTSELGKSELQTLFVTDTHYQKYNRKTPKNSRLYSYVNIHTVLRCFYLDVIEGIFGYRLIDNSQAFLNDKEIQFINLGDTRHIALINLIAEGGTPTIAMQLAGHDNPDMAAHYYSNISSLIECKTYQEYRKFLRKNTEYTIGRNTFEVQKYNEYLPVENQGRCYSSSFKEGKIDDCLKVCGPNGEIGYCPSCKYYRDMNVKNYFEDDNIYKRKLEDSCKQLEIVINQARIYKDRPDEIGQALLNVQSNAYSYEEYLKEKLKNGGNING